MNEALTSPRVTLIIVSYNQEAFVSEAIASAIAQDYDNLEIIVSDDGSTDLTPRLIADWASRYPGKVIPLLHPTNAGISKNLNSGLARCTGELVSFLGGDDALLPSKISDQVKWFRDRPGAVLCGHRVDVRMNGVIVTADPAYENYACGSGPVRFIREGMKLHGASLMVRASAMPSFGFDETIPLGSDLMFCIDVLSEGGHYGFVDQVLAVYRIHSGNISKQKIDALLKDYEQTFRQAARRYPHLGRDCERAITRHIHYYGGVKKLMSGHPREAIAGFKAAIAREPLFVKAWVRLLQAHWRMRGDDL